MASAGPRVVVVGGGVVGRCAAYYLSRAGAQVDLLDPQADPSPTTRASLGVLTHFNGGDNPYSLLYRDGHALHARLAEELRQEIGADVGWRNLGGIDLVLDEADESEARELLAYNRERGCGVEWIEPDGLRRMEPTVAGSVRGGVYFPGDQRVDPVRLADALLQAARAHGARLHPGETLAAVEGSDPEGIALRTSVGQRRAEFAVLAAGARSRELAASCGASVPVRPVRGQHARFAGGPTPGHVLRWGGHHLLPAEGGLVVGATVEEVGFDPAITPEAGERFAQVARRVLGRVPGPAGQWAGLRPKPKGARPLIGPLREHPRLFVATGHYKSGILLGPITGQVLADWILQGTAPRDMAYFAPER